MTAHDIGKIITSGDRRCSFECEGISVVRRGESLKVDVLNMTRNLFYTA